jgi:hypothetical protein
MQFHGFAVNEQWQRRTRAADSQAFLGGFRYSRALAFLIPLQALLDAAVR